MVKRGKNGEALRSWESMSGAEAYSYMRKIKEHNPTWNVDMYSEGTDRSALYVSWQTATGRAGWWIFTARQAEECLT